MEPTASTRDRLQECALRLFAERGYKETSVADIAKEVGVSHMTFFRHFATKQSVVVDDVFDPMIARVVAQQPLHLPPLVRAAYGFLLVLEQGEADQELATPGFRRRVQLAANTPELSMATWASGQATQQAVAEALIESGSEVTASQAAAGATIGACTAVLLAWAAGPGEESAGDCLRRALRTLVGESE